MTKILALILVALLLFMGISHAASDAREVVLASEILAMIERGEPIEYDNVVVEGDLDLSRRPLETVHFNNTIFQGYVNFEASNFTGDAWFWRANFSGYAEFSSAQFSGYADFSWAQFTGADADFWDTKFSGNADFEGAKFGGNAYFGVAEFTGGDMDFRRAFTCWGADIGAAALGGGAEFCRNANFRGAKFSGNAYFRGAKFGGNADFRWAQFTGRDVDFSSAQFSGCADFSWVLFSGDVTFEDSSFDHANLMLEDAKSIRILQLSDATFENESRICLSGTDYERLYVHWDSIKDALIYNGEVCPTLAKNFQTIEYFEGADDCYYQYRLWRQNTKSWITWSKYVDILARWSCGYGVRPGYTLYWSFGFIFLFGIFFWVGNGIQKFACPYHDNVADEQNKKPNRLSFVDSIYFSALVFVSQPPPDMRPTGYWKYAVTVEDVFGWLLLALFLVTLGNVMIR